MTSLHSRISLGSLRRPLRFLALAIGLMAGIGAVQAESNVFLIENSDGYGVDNCLADGEPCGSGVANAWCRTHGYDHALSYGRISEAGTGSGIMTIAGGKTRPKTCTGPQCEPVVAIACGRDAKAF